MGTPTKRPSYDDAPYATAPADVQESDKLFDITCVVGSIYRGGGNGLTPREAAFLLIARHGADGLFVFPNEDGSLNHIDVATVNAT